MAAVTTRTVLAASTKANCLAGSQFEQAPYDLTIEAAVQTDATGVLITFQTGTDVVQEESPAQVGTINVQPKYPDDYYLRDVVAKGEKINIIARDTSGAQRIVMVNCILTPYFGQ
jgi:hypothetical protein